MLRLQVGVGAGGVGNLGIYEIDSTYMYKTRLAPKFTCPNLSWNPMMSHAARFSCVRNHRNFVFLGGVGTYCSIEQPHRFLVDVIKCPIKYRHLAAQSAFESPNNAFYHGPILVILVLEMIRFVFDI